MYWYDWLSVIFIWSIVGGFSLVMTHCGGSGGAIDMAEGWEFVNPIHIHKYNNVNWFGAFIVTLIYNALCPIGAVCYWFYKLCTFGRSY
jgi:hypothetical protein